MNKQSSQHKPPKKIELKQKIAQKWRRKRPAARDSKRSKYSDIGGKKTSKTGNRWMSDELGVREDEFAVVKGEKVDASERKEMVGSCWGKRAYVGVVWFRGYAVVEGYISWLIRGVAFAMFSSRPSINLFLIEEMFSSS